MIHWRRSPAFAPIGTAFQAAVLIAGAALAAGCSAFAPDSDSGSGSGWPSISGFTPDDAPPFQLRVSPDHRRDFTVFAGKTGAGRISAPREIDRVFATPGSQSDAYCTAILSGRAFWTADLALITPAQQDEYLRNRLCDSLHSLHAGCRNFFEMNDLQPCIMHRKLGCRSA